VLYVGEVNHKGKIYPGEHQAVVNRTVWTKANDLTQEPEPRNRERLPLGVE
jgi:site-specific DNA recombinase